MKKRFWFEVHWLLSIVLGVIIAIIGITGAALSFRGEITELLNKEIMFVESDGKEPMAINELLERASVSLKDSRINSIALYSDPDKTARLSASAAGSTNTRGRTQYINPYTAEILPYESMKGAEFFSLMVSWHRWLGDSSRSWGKQTVAIATVALIVITITGLYLYLPFMRRNFYSSLTIDFKKKGRGFLYKLHSVFGVWTLIFVLLMSFTGLWWSYDWYRNGIYYLAGVERPAPRQQTPPQPNAAVNAENRGEARGEGGNNRGETRNIEGGGGAPNVESERNINAAANAENRGEARGADRAATRSSEGAPNAAQNREGSNAAQYAQGGAPNLAQNLPRTSEDYLEAAKAYDLFKQTVGEDYRSVTISLPQRGDKLFTLSYVPLNPAHSRASNQLQLNTENNAIVRHAKYDDKTLGEKFISSIFPLHSGDFFGVAGLVLYCVSSLAMALFAITGYMLYYERFVREAKRKKAKKESAANEASEEVLPQVAARSAGELV